ncbi:MAG: PQQ-like beta-propeller repeat protein [Phycisphaerae bacterium]|nr:PQQ-like beta-propeller repeat protein [Phycisphaerae bacterium]
MPTRTNALLRPLIVLLALCPAAAAFADGATSQPGGDWPKWRGPNGDNVPALKSFPQDLEKGLKKLWSVDMLCKGKNAAAWSCPSILGDKLVVTGRDENKDTIVCLNADTGAPVWNREYDSPGPAVQYGTGPRATPLIDGDVVYTFGCMGRVACSSMKDGAEIWKRDAAEMGGKMPMWGHSSTPLLLDDNLIVQVGGKNLAVALNKKTGATVWSSFAADAGYAAVTTATIGGKEQLVVFGAAGLFGLAPDSGKKVWEFAWPTAFGMNCTTPIMVGGRMLICSSENGGKGGMAMVKFEAGQPKMEWENHKVGPGHNDPVIIGKYAYAYTNYSMEPKGFTCVDLTNGEQKWFNAEVGGPGTAVKVGDNVLCLANRGKLALVHPDERGMRRFSEFEAIKGGPVWTQPIVARGKVYVRFANQLICYQIGE